MTATRPAPLFGQSVGEAQRALRALVDRVFDDADTSFETWIVLNTLATQGPRIPAAQLRDDLAYGLSADPDTIAGLLADVRASGLIRSAADSEESDEDQVELSSAGEAFHGQLREAIVSASNRVTADIDPAELATAGKVLIAVKARAEALLDRDDVLTAAH